MKEQYSRRWKEHVPSREASSGNRDQFRVSVGLHCALGKAGEIGRKQRALLLRTCLAGDSSSLRESSTGYP